MPVTGAGLEGIVATESRLCFIDGDAGLLSYQGFRIETLAEHATFEEVIYLLWHGKLPKQSELDELKAALVANRAIPAEVEAFLKSDPKGFADARAAHGGFHAGAVGSRCQQRASRNPRRKRP